MAGAAAGWVGHVPKPRRRGGHWVAGAGPGAGLSGRSDGLGASREGRREREVSGGPGIPWAGCPRSVDTAAAEKVLFIPS